MTLSADLETMRLATAIDCEGCINIYFLWDRGICIMPRVSIANSEEKWLLWFKEILGFGFINSGAGPSRSGFNLAFTYRQTEKILWRCLRFMKIKNNAAKRILTYYHLRDKLGQKVARAFAFDTAKGPSLIHLLHLQKYRNRIICPKT
jgi:hypothetical protein